MMKKIRIVLATIFFISITLLFLDKTGTLAAYLGWMAKIQFFPAILAMNFGIVLGLIVLTLLLGRIYCSVICPLGVLQDIAYGIRRKKNTQDWKPEKAWLRYAILILFIVGAIAGFDYIVYLIAPYSTYGKIVSGIINPGVLVTTIAVILLVVVTALAVTGGRTWCNTVCPVGTVLGFFSRFALFRPVFDATKCKNCNLCQHNCKASCIDVANKHIDYSRCVSCFDCVTKCKFGALKYRFAYKKKNNSSEESSDNGRRAFLSTTTILASATIAKAQEGKHLDGGFAPVSEHKKPQRTESIVPFGAKSHKNFYSHCTACQLCVNKCPSRILTPSTKLETLLQPEMTFEHGYCRPECTTCSQVCPAGAILPITKEEKSSIHIGIAVPDASLCISCAHCAVRCPAGAIKMVSYTLPDGTNKTIPAVREDKCIGCGECENLCPVHPISAIHVEGYTTHKTDD